MRMRAMTGRRRRHGAPREAVDVGPLGAVLAAAVLAGCGESPAPSGAGAGTASVPRETPPAEPWFDEVAAEAGLDFVHTPGPIRHLFPEIVAGGAGWLDHDGDGDLDLYLVQGGDFQAPSASAVNRLYRNDGAGRFEDVTATAGVGDPGYGMGCTAADYDGDGDVDLYVTNVGPNVLYRNDGDGTFTDVTEAAGVGHPGWGTSCAFVDYDGDGDLDLFVVNYVIWSVDTEIECRAGSGARDYCKPANYHAPAQDVLYRNDGDGTFTDVTEAAGIHRAFGNGLGVACGDYDLDGRMDVYVANDGMPNQLWLNQGDGRFVDAALASGCAVNMQGKAEAGMGVAAIDVEDDGDLDLFMTHLRDETNTFYLNEGGIFDDATASIGLSAPSIRYTGFGMGFADFDHDGLHDLYVANGRVGMWDPAPDPDDPYAEPNQLFRGSGQGRFEEVPGGGCAAAVMGTSRAAAFADYDDDGDVDVAVVNRSGAVQLLRNRKGGDGHWVALRVLDANGADALGARVRLEAGGRARWRQVQVAYSYCASNDPRVNVGLGGATTVDRVTVFWPEGGERSYGPLAAGRLHVLER
ncbi:MAG: CRTAC1 family protein [Planctomycetota bacterium]